MTLHKATKVVIITEKLIADKVCQIVDEAGASGYTRTAAGGKGSRDVRRSLTDRASVVNEFSNIKIEVIVPDRATAEDIMNRVSSKFFKNYSGITYLENIEILRPEKF